MLFYRFLYFHNFDFTFGYHFDSRVIFFLFISVIALFCFLYNLVGLLSLSE